MNQQHKEKPSHHLHMSGTPTQALSQDFDLDHQSHDLSPVMELLRNLVIASRRKSDMTIVELAQKSGLTFQAIQRLETNKCEHLRLGDLLQLCDVLTLPDDWFLRARLVLLKYPRAASSQSKEQVREARMKSSAILKQLNETFECVLETRPIA